MYFIDDKFTKITPENSFPNLFLSLIESAVNLGFISICIGRIKIKIKSIEKGYLIDIENA